MDLISLVVLLVIVGVVLWAINTFIPMEASIKKILNAIVIIAVIVFVLSLFTGYLPHIRVGR